MPATCATSSSTSSTTTTSSQQQTTSKVENVKQIGICVAPGLQSTACSSNKFPSSVSTNYYNSGAATTGVTTSATSIPVGTLQSLGLMVTRFANDPSSRHQTVILHPRPVNPTRVPNVVVTTSTGAVASGGGTTLRTVTTVPISNTSIRTQQSAQPASQSSTIQVMNLSVSNPSSNTSPGHQQTTVKQICPPSGRFNIASALPLESLELVVTNDSATARPIRLHPDMNIVNVKPTNVSANLQHNMAKLTRASVVTTQQPTKMINIHGTSGGGLNAGTTQQVTRLGIIGQIPSSAVVTTASGSKSVINTLTLTKPLQILNPSPNVAPGIVNSGSTTVHSVVSVSNVASFAPGVANAQNQQKSNPALMTLTTTAGVSQARHALITTNSGVQHSVALSQQSRTMTNTTTSITSSALTVQHYNQQPHMSLSTPLTTTTSTSLRPNILSSPANSPVKQSQVQQQSTPSSPRPSILIRKRVANDMNQVSNTYKPQSATSSAPAKVLSVSSGENLKVLMNKHSDATEEANKVGESCFRSGHGTPNSDATGATPRKKPRKQLLEPFNLTTSQNIKLLSSIDDSKEKKEERDFTEKEGIITICKKPRPSLLTPYNVGCKSLQYHFLRYSDVRQKSEKKLTLSELSHEGLQRKNGWKIHHLGTQMDDISDNESVVYERLTSFLNKFERNGNSLPNNITVVGVATLNSGRNPSQVSVIDKLSDLIRGNLQRSNLFQEQICESKQLLVKLTNDHKERVAKLTRKCANKRTYITK